MDKEMKRKLTAMKVKSVAFSALECGACGTMALLRLLIIATSAIALFSGEVPYWAVIIGFSLVWGISKSVQMKPHTPSELLTDFKAKRQRTYGENWNAY